MSTINSRIQKSSDQYYHEFVDKLRNSSLARKVLFLGPALSLMTVFLVLPLIYTVILSFSPEWPITSLDFTLANYFKIASTDAYVNIITRTAILTLQVTVASMVLGYAMAYAMVMFTEREELVLLLIIIPFWVNYLVRNFSLFAIFQNDGAFDQLVNLLPFITDFSQSVLFTRFAVILGLMYSFLPVAVLPMYASLSNMDKSLINAAKDLGAGPIKTFFTITLPQSLSGVFVGLLLVMIPSFGAFVTPAMLGGSSATMIGSIIQLQYMSVFDLPFGSAIATFTATTVLVVLVFTTKMSGVPLIDND
jgi:spermidine/putrescine transport system permease protein